MAEHKYAQVLRWIADGKKVQWQGSSGVWMLQSHEESLQEIAADSYIPGRYRLAPRTITINGREIEAPIDQIKSGEPCYCTDVSGAMTAVRFSEEDIKHRFALVKGRLFSTPEAARDAFDAVTSLLIPDDK